MTMRRDFSLHTPDGDAPCHLFHPDGAGPFPGVVFFHDGIGLRDAMHEMAARFADAGFAVALPNLFYRAGELPPFDAKTVFGDPAERERLTQLIRTTTPAGAMRDTRALVDWMRGEAIVAKGKLGCVGYCMGGHMALTAASSVADELGAVASIHGARLVTDAPDSPHELAPSMKARVYVGWAENDHTFSAQDADTLEQALLDAKVSHELELYRAAHGFAVHDTPAYDAVSAELHYERVIELFDGSLR